MKTKEDIFIIFIITILNLVTFPTYSQTDTLNCSESISNFIENNWERKSKKLIEDFESTYFIKIKPCLIGKSKQEILLLFGNASSENLTGTTYFINNKPNEKKESRCIYIVFDINGNCTASYYLITLPTIY